MRVVLESVHILEITSRIFKNSNESILDNKILRSKMKVQDIINCKIKMVCKRPDIFKRIGGDMHKFRKILIGVLGLMLLMLPTVWSDTRFEMDPYKVAAAETNMWQAYYTNDHVALLQELKNLMHNQFDISISDAEEIGELLAIAAMKFESAKSNYKTTVLPDLELAYSRLNGKLDVEFDPKEAAMAELDWWVARRTPGRDSAEEVGRLITHLYIVLFGENQPAFERAGLLRAQAAHIRDKGGASCNWGMVEQLLQQSYQALEEGLKHITNIYSAKVKLNWDLSKEKNIAGYKIYYGVSSGNYGSYIDVGNRTSYTITDLVSGLTYYFVITAYNNNGNESNYSAEVSREATVDIVSPSLSQNPEEENALQKAEKDELQGIKTPLQNPEVTTVGVASPSLPQNPVEEYALQKAEKDELQRIRTLHQNPEVTTVGVASPPLPQDHVEENPLQKAEKDELQEIKTPLQNPEVVWLPQGVDLTKHTTGPFTVKARVEGIDEQRHPSIFPRIEYSIGSGNSYGNFDMIHEGDNVWRFDIPDPKWNRYRSSSLHYHVEVFDNEGNVIAQSRWEMELIDSFIQQD
jgi:hypothetical protein